MMPFLPLDSAYADKGFSFIELLVTLSVTSVLVTIGIPSFQGLISKIHTESEVREVMDNVWLARKYAIDSKQHVTICGSSTGDSCDAGWNKGFLVFSHVETDTTFINSTLTPVVSRYLTDDNYQLKGNVGKFTFRPSGLIKGQSGSLLVCPDYKSEGDRQRIVISRGGRIRVYDAGQVSKLKYLSEMTCG